MKKKNKIGVILFKKEMEEPLNGKDDVRFKEEIEKAGYMPEFFYYQKFAVFFKRNDIEIFYNNLVVDFDSFLFFIGRYNSLNGNLNSLFIVDCLLNMGVKVISLSKAAIMAKNKRETMLALAKNNLPIIPTGINFSQFYLDEHLKRNMHNKIVAKANVGTWGYGVAVLDSAISFISFMEMVGANAMKPFDILIQPFIDTEGEDYRVIVVGDKVVAGMRRKARGIEFRANISKGGIGTPIKPDKKMADLAIKATRVIGLAYAGVDIIKDNKGKMMIVEVNANPGLEIEKITRINVVEKIVEYGISESKR